ncbi:MAG: BatA and WFA domain-containing protein [Spirochaetales bacterium]|nr:BatA and WFA domain-containing protein [Spirochaetales bacterium]
MVKNPQVFWALFGLVPLIGILLFNYYRTSRILKKINRSAKGERIKDIYFIKKFLLSLFLIFAYVLLIFALAGFMWTKDIKAENSRGLDIVFVVDISNSMSSDDILPSRLDRVSDTIKSLVSSWKNLRYSVVVFRGSAEVVVPLTENVETVYYVLDSLYPDLLASPGTDLESGILEGFSAFSDHSDTMKMVFLFTDGGEQSIDIGKISQEAENLRILLNVVAVGSADGGKIYSPDGKELLDSRGAPVVSRPNFGLLENIATSVSGNYFVLSDNLIISKLLKVLNEENQKIGKDSTRVEYPDKYRIFAFAAWIMLCLYLLVKGTKWKKII